MKQILLFILSCAFLPCLAQDYMVQSIQPAQIFYLDKASGDEYINYDSRSTLELLLPSDAVSLYYSFTTTRAKIKSDLNLFSQLDDLVTQEGGHYDPSVSEITVPTGQGRCNVYLVEDDNSWKFEDGENFIYLPTGSRENFSHGIIKVPEIPVGNVYLCFENTDKNSSVSISVEVVALIDTSSTSQAISGVVDLIETTGDIVGFIGSFGEEKREKRRKEEEFNNLYNTGWIMFEAGDFEASISYSNQALEMKEHPGLYFNIGLAQWCQDSSSKCMKTYLKGLNMIYQSETKEEAINVLKTGLKNMADAQQTHKFVSKQPPASKLLSMKLEEVKAVQKWKKKF